MVQEIEHPTCGPIKLVGTPVKFSSAKPSIRSAPPTLGQHTQEVLLELGYSQQEVDSLREQGVVA
jgi:succinate--hydroxymethylglutarate CoA-transferase